MDNLKLYNLVRLVPDTAKKAIGAGRLKGKTDINPMWRLKTLTEQFGPCGVGWGYTIDKQWTEAGANGEVAAFCNISLWIKVDGVKSEPIPGTGGSAFVAKEKAGPYTSDECYKMALTDAISVACKALGVGADVYWDADRTKYDQRNNMPEPPKMPVCEDCGKEIPPIKHGGKVYSPSEIAENSQKAFGKELCWGCAGRRKEAAAQDEAAMDAAYRAYQEGC